MTDEKKELQVYESHPLTANDIRAQVNLIQSVMKEVMQKGEHYGVIPGCGDKPSLLKPGAEKIMMTFQMVADPEVEIIELYNEKVVGHREYRLTVRLSSKSGIYLGAGVGSCSTMETKYRYRGGEKISTGQSVPKEYWNLKKEGKTAEAQTSIGGKGFGAGKIDGKWEICEIGEKIEHDNPADYYNICEKMAKKRALVDAILTVTAASDIFTQDLEDMTENGVAPVKQTKKEPVKEPIKKQQESEMGQTVTFTITKLDSKSGEKNGKKWHQFFILDGETVYKTFDSKFAAKAKEAYESAIPVTVTFTEDQYGKNITAIELNVPEQSIPEEVLNDQGN